ncbi:MAG TPA: pyridoxamine 5'-phosphate oxidase family protein [Bacteroidales bacterium]|jgi:hypothetical protein|nr:pyridoxamine 5'-phosphate oxidase family protein [Bacteroidales bacterium]
MQQPIPQKIYEFIHEHHVLTLATVNNSIPWCCNCFYVYNSANNSFIFSSDLTTRHASEMLQNTVVAGSIVLETEVIGKIQGLQFSGQVALLEKSKLTHAKKLYLQRFPYAILKKTTLWECVITYAKLTDNRLGFGTKLIWE